MEIRNKLLRRTQRRNGLLLPECVRESFPEKGTCELSFKMSKFTRQVGSEGKENWERGNSVSKGPVCWRDGLQDPLEKR